MKFYLLLFYICLSTSLIAQQTTTITGKVVTRNGNAPLGGVNVTIPGKSTKAETDSLGRYSIRIGPADKSLVFSFTGYKTQIAPIDGRSRLDVVMEEAISVLEDVVVIGYGQQKRGDLTGSVSTIKADELARAKSVSFQEAMQGKLAGVQVMSASGEPGAGVNINIRGANSVNAQNQPLYVIDGVQIDVNDSEVARSTFGNTSLLNPLSGINVADIESIEVLKDASATAIFGARGANGVIIVTTKSGKKDASALNLDVYWGISTPSKKMDMLNGHDYAAYRHELNPADPAYGEDSDGDGVPDRPKDFSGLPAYDWQKEVLRPALSQSYNLSYSGGNAKTTFSTSLGYFRQEGLVKENTYERYNFQLKVNHSASDKLKLGTSVNGSYIMNSGPSGNGGIGSNHGIVQMFILYKPINVAEEGLSTIDPDNLGLSNPNDFIRYARKKNPLVRVMADAFAEYKILRNLNLRASGGAVLTHSTSDQFYPTTTSWGYTPKGLALINNNSSVTYYQTSTLTYNKTFNRHHRIDAMAGAEIYSYTSKDFSIRGEGFDIQSLDATDIIHQAKTITQPATTTKSRSTRMSQFGRVNYAFKNRYLATATLRRDGSSKFGAGNKYAWFPSAALAWKVSDEPFMRNASFISNLKLRTSFGVTGNDRIPPYQALARTANGFYSGVTTGELGITPSSFANPNLKWETTYQYDAGIDLEVLEGRLAFTVDAYTKQTKDMLLQADIPSQTGYYKQWQNIGRVDNKGLEFAVNSLNIKRDHFTWQTNFNISTNKNKVVSLGSVSFVPVTSLGSMVENVGRVIVGQPIGTGYGYVFDGVYQTEDFDNPSPGTWVLKPGVVKLQGINVQPGDMKFKDLDGNGEVDNVNDRTIISNSNPQFFGGLTNNFTYRNFDLSIFLHWMYGNDILYVGRYRYEAFQANNLTYEYWNNRWTETNPSNQYPSLRGKGKYETSTYLVEDGSFLRLKNITIGYNLPEPALKKLKLKGLRFYVTGDNLYVWTKYSGFDPEVNSYNPLLTGMDNISYPRSRTVTVGLNIKY
jgi:TonB-linked SusC/RagA family outer membrane protein